MCTTGDSKTMALCEKYVAVCMYAKLCQHTTACAPSAGEAATACCGHSQAAASTCPCCIGEHTPLGALASCVRVPCRNRWSKSDEGK